MSAKEEPPAEKIAKAPVKEDQVEAKVKAETKEDAEDAAEDELLPEAKPSFERSEVPKDNPKLRQDAVHVYGLDFLQTEHMNEIFSQFDHRYVEWINDSSANIIFKAKDSAKKALESLSYPKVGDAPWRRTPDILVNDDCPPVFLQMRLATQHDVKKSKHAVPKVQTEDTRIVPTRNRRQGLDGDAQIRPYRDGMTTELLEQAGLIFGKRKTEEPLTEEEVAKRQKRADRFKEEESPVVPEAVAEKPAAEKPAAAVAEAAKETSDHKKETSDHKNQAEKLKGITLEVTDEEITRRKKRAERFAEEAAKAKTTPATTPATATATATSENTGVAA